MLVPGLNSAEGDFQASFWTTIAQAMDREIKSLASDTSLLPLGLRILLAPTDIPTWGPATVLPTHWDLGSAPVLSKSWFLSREFKLNQFRQYICDVEKQ
ncbi:hypothetical protein Y1Q_0015613 [Alligator mississippiensis]|uniref:Uncharacterized protein n=1 Tax=Alligator mississippiensis TaxID=8496 RepID=A0A151NND4_ALLMI|nr:hypothetical protein Y1Q_0015613 [Alligator mississippiensis]